MEYKGAADIVQVLGGSLAPDARGNYLCRCPVHGDARPSLSVCDRDDRTLVHCFAGCSQTDVIAALRRLKLLPGRPNVGVYATEPVEPLKPVKPLWTPDPLKPWREASPLRIRRSAFRLRFTAREVPSQPRA